MLSVIFLTPFTFALSFLTHAHFNFSSGSAIVTAYEESKQMTISSQCAFCQNMNMLSTILSHCPSTICGKLKQAKKREPDKASEFVKLHNYWERVLNITHS